jgi:hypothetical protein
VPIKLSQTRNQTSIILRPTILENDAKVDFHLRLDDGTGIVYTLQPLEEKTTYKIKVRAFNKLNVPIKLSQTRNQTSIILRPFSVKLPVHTNTVYKSRKLSTIRNFLSKDMPIQIYV